jgi:hypothetical protein
MPPAFDDGADFSRDEDRADQPEPAREQRIAKTQERDARRGVDFRVGVEEDAARAVRGKLLAHCEKPESTEHRQQQRHREEDRPHPLVPAAPAEREIHAEAAMQPAGNQ